MESRSEEIPKESTSIVHQSGATASNSRPDLYQAVAALSLKTAVWSLDLEMFGALLMAPGQFLDVGDSAPQEVR